MAAIVNKAYCVACCIFEVSVKRIKRKCEKTGFIQKQLDYLPSISMRNK